MIQKQLGDRRTRRASRDSNVQTTKKSLCTNCCAETAQQRATSVLGRHGVNKPCGHTYSRGQRLSRLILGTGKKHIWQNIDLVLIWKMDPTPV